MTWPSEEQIVAEARSMGLTNSRAFGESLASAIAQFEQLTGWTPFFATGSDTEYFNPPRYWTQEALYLSKPFFCIDAVYAYADQGREGTLLVEGQDYNIIEWRFPTGQTACHALEFLRSPGTAKRSIKVVGTPGAVTDIPADVFEAVKKKSIALASPGMRGAVEGPVAEIKQGQVSYKVGTEAGRGRADVFDAEFKATVAKYLRIAV